TLDESVPVAIRRIGRAVPPGGDADSLERRLVRRAHAVAVLVEEHRNGRVAALRELVARHPPAARERVGSEGEADREACADPARAVDASAAAKRETPELPHVAELELGDAGASTVLDVQPQIRAIVERLLDGYAGRFEAGLGSVEAIARLSAKRQPEHPSVGENSESGAIVARMAAMCLPMKHEAGQRQARQDQRRAAEKFGDLAPVALRASPDPGRKRYRRA